MNNTEQLIGYLKATGREKLAQEYEEKWLPIVKKIEERKKYGLLAHNQEEQELKMWRNLALSLADAVQELAKKNG